ncbi:phage virion morphogenesis protein [Bosea sp. (in: a-proteobacteria)]|jgi:phage virion morphogenesis protein|uniref:phage virion morphogenesis protein n=1 Tax=Bosea sp. (in: a-proteobacteria) TaxID=1871050 RepID=UPI003566616D
MTPEVRITLDPTSEGIARLEKLVDRATRKPDLLKNLGEALLDTTRKRFDSQKDPKGTAWTPLRPLTIAIRGNDAPILTVSGNLKGSLNYEVVGDTLRIGPSAIYGPVHQFGATIKAKHGVLTIPLGKAKNTGKFGDTLQVRSVTIPARPFVGYGPEDERAATETAQDWFDLDP